MAELNFTSLRDTIVPPSYIEEVVIRSPSESELNIFNQPGIRFIDEYGNEEFTTTPIVSEEQQVENVIALDAKVFLMLNESTFEDLRSKQQLQLYVLIADNRQKINLLRGGDYKFEQLQELLSSGEISYKTISFRELEENVSIVSSEETQYYKLTKSITIQARASRNIAVFSFVTVPTDSSQNARASLASSNILYGRIAGEMVLSQGSVLNQSYYFLNSDNQIWAGAVHQHIPDGSQSSVYMEGLKHTNELHSTLTPERTSVYKVFDRRQTDIQVIFDTILQNFNFIEETKILQDNQTSELLSFTAKTSGISPVMSSIVKKEQLNLANKPAKHTSNVIFIDAEQILRENSKFSSLIDRLDQNELDYIKKTTYIDNFEVDRVSLLNNEERQETIISTSFKEGDDTGKIQVKNVADSPITSDNKYSVYAYYEEEASNSFGNPLQKYKVLSFTDEVPQLLRKSDFYYRISLRMQDGLQRYITEKISNIENNLLAFKSLYSKLNNPTFFDKEGNFLERAKSLENNNSLLEVISIMVSSLTFFFDLFGTTPTNLLRSIYYSSNTETGNIYEMRKVYDSYEKLYTFLSETFGIVEVGSGVGSIVASPSGKQNRQIAIETKSDILSLNFDKSVGLNFVDSYNPIYKLEVGQTTTRAPVFMPAVSRNVVSSTDRVDESLSSPEPDETYLTYYKPHSIFLDKDYLVQKRSLSSIQDNNDYLEYLSILLNDSIRQSVQDKYSGRLDFSTTKKKQSKQILRGQKDIQYYRYVSILESLAENGTSVDFDFDLASSNIDISRNRNEIVEDAEDKSKLMNLDDISSKLPLALSKVVQSSNANNEATSLISDAPGKNPLAFTYFRFTSPIGVNFNPEIKIPFQYGSFNPVSDLVLYDTNENLRLFDTNNLAYYYYNYSLIGETKILTGFEEGSMRPIYANLSEDILEEQNLGLNTKYMCKVHKYANNEFLTNLYDQIDEKIINQHFVVIEQGADADRLDLSALINQAVIAAPAPPSIGISLAGDVQQIKNINEIGFNVFEKYFSTSIYVTQPVEVRELKFEFDRPNLEAPTPQTVVSNIGNTTAAPSPTATPPAASSPTTPSAASSPASGQVSSGAGY